MSRHLGVLREAGLVRSERRGRQIVYEIDTTVLQDVVEHLLRWVRPGTARGAAAPAPSAPPVPPDTVPDAG